MHATTKTRSQRGPVEACQSFHMMYHFLQARAVLTNIRLMQKSAVPSTPCLQAAALNQRNFESFALLTGLASTAVTCRNVNKGQMLTCPGQH